jgi:hypothetical protein
LPSDGVNLVTKQRLARALKRFAGQYTCRNTPNLQV